MKRKGGSSLSGHSSWAVSGADARIVKLAGKVLDVNRRRKKSDWKRINREVDEATATRTKSNQVTLPKLKFPATDLSKVLQ